MLLNSKRHIGRREAEVNMIKFTGAGCAVFALLRCLIFSRRFSYDPTTTLKIRLRLIYADGDAAATLQRPWRLGFAFDVLLYPFYMYIKSEVQPINV